MMKTIVGFKFLAAGLIACLAIRVTPLAAQEHYLPTGKPDPIAILPAPPAADSTEQAADLAEVQYAVKHRTASELAHGKAETDFSVETFADAIGPDFKLEKLPKTKALFKEVVSEAKAVTDVGKKHWKRLRPYEVDPSLLDGEKEPSFGYPSGHSTRAVVTALLLADLYPEKRNAILAEGRQVGWDRVVMGRHYESDVNAGRVLGQAIVRQLYESPSFGLDFAAAKAEVNALKESNGAKEAITNGAKMDLQEARK
jgi:acid phosphatase (class A)